MGNISPLNYLSPDLGPGTTKDHLFMFCEGLPSEKSWNGDYAPDAISFEMKELLYRSSRRFSTTEAVIAVTSGINSNALGRL